MTGTPASATATPVADRGIKAPVQEPAIAATSADTHLYAVLLSLESAARKQTSIDDLRFQIVNETHRLLGYFQCFTWEPKRTGGFRITAVSGVSDVDPNAPVVVAMRSIIKAVQKRADQNSVLTLQPEDFEPAVAERWNEWFPEFGLWCPLVDTRSRCFGGFFITHESAFEAPQIQAISVLSEAYAHAWRSLEPKASRRSIWSALARRTVRWGLVALFCAAMFIPVRQSVLAPAEIVPYQPVSVTSPIDGVINSIPVSPNAPVTTGQTLFVFDDTKARSEHALAEAALKVAAADYRRATNKSFHDSRSKAERQTFRLRVEEKQLERDYAAAQLERTVVVADREGLAVFNDVNDWVGRPVKIGEQIMTIANPDSTEVEIWLAVEDGTNLDQGAAVELFLNIDPNDPMAATIRQTSYKPTESPTGSLGFRLRASLKGDTDKARLGLKGTAKIYGEKVSLFYFLFRRPWSLFRQKFGV